MNKSYGQLVWIEEVVVEDVVEMRRSNHFGAVGSACQKVFEHTAEQTRAIYKGISISERKQIGEISLSRASPSRTRPGV